MHCLGTLCLWVSRKSIPQPGAQSATGPPCYYNSNNRSVVSPAGRTKEGSLGSPAELISIGGACMITLALAEMCVPCREDSLGIGLRQVMSALHTQDRIMSRSLNKGLAQTCAIRTIRCALHPDLALIKCVKFRLRFAPALSPRSCLGEQRGRVTLATACPVSNRVGPPVRTKSASASFVFVCNRTGTHIAILHSLFLAVDVEHLSHFQQIKLGRKGWRLLRWGNADNRVHAGLRLQNTHDMLCRAWREIPGVAKGRGASDQSQSRRNHTPSTRSAGLLTARAVLASETEQSVVGWSWCVPAPYSCKARPAITSSTDRLLALGAALPESTTGAGAPRLCGTLPAPRLFVAVLPATMLVAAVLMETGGTGAGDTGLARLCMRMPVKVNTRVVHSVTASAMVPPCALLCGRFSLRPFMCSRVLHPRAEERSCRC